MGERLPETQINSKQELLAWLDEKIVENRFTISVFFPLNGIVLLLASAEGVLPDPLAFNGLMILFGTIIMRSPLLIGTLPLTGRRATFSVGLLTLYAYGIEYLGVHTGVPYGEFYYGVDLGPTLFGVPLGLPVFFVPLVMNAYLLCLLLLGERSESTTIRLLAVISTVLFMDVILDPGAVALGFWVYADGGLFYNVPLSNYIGWVLSATVAVVLLDYGYNQSDVIQRVDQCPFMLDDLVSFVILWGGINLWFGNVIPALCAAALACGLLRAQAFDHGLLRLSSISGLLDRKG
jgi:putative membrane protein